MAAMVTDILSPEKRTQILRGAAAVFARDGYEGASVARIAQEAGVSKGTLYNYFESKAEMFSAWVGDECERKLAAMFADGRGDEEPAAALRAIGLRMVGMMLSDAGATIYRVVIAEAGKFPELARAFWEAGPCRAIGSLAARLADDTRRGRLAVSDPEFAAEQFFALCQARVVMRRKLAIREQASEAEVERVVEAAVSMFLATYGADRDAR